ncbi:uncharacterized, partial [Tachysurus ichikawai]
MHENESRLSRALRAYWCTRQSRYAKVETSGAGQWASRGPGLLRDVCQEFVRKYIKAGDECKSLLKK